MSHFVISNDSSVNIKQTQIRTPNLLASCRSRAKNQMTIWVKNEKNQTHRPTICPVLKP